VDSGPTNGVSTIGCTDAVFFDWRYQRPCDETSSSQTFRSPLFGVSMSIPKKRGTHAAKYYKDVIKATLAPNSNIDTKANSDSHLLFHQGVGMYFELVQFVVTTVQFEFTQMCEWSLISLKFRSKTIEGTCPRLPTGGSFRSYRWTIRPWSLSESPALSQHTKSSDNTFL